MRASVRVVHELIRGIAPGDDLESEHRVDSLRWLESTDDVFRRIKPASPDRHLVSYILLIDPDDDSILLVDHINAGLWLPPGGHVDPDEHPADTARREAREELGIDPEFTERPPKPSFVTVTRTVGVDHGHVDVSLWFLLAGARGMPLGVDPTEFNEARWWTPANVRAEEAERFDPHYRRFVTKVCP